MKKNSKVIFLMVLCNLLSGCITNVFTGANLVYDRHSVYKKMHDYEISADVNRVLAVNKTFQNEQCTIDIGVFKGDLLIAGHLPTQDYLDEFNRRMSQVKGYNHYYNEMVVVQRGSNGVQDAWITGKIRSQIFADDAIDPNAFKIITSDGVVYIMGEAKPDEADKVVRIARYTEGVVKVVKLLRYFTYQDRK